MAQLVAPERIPLLLKETLTRCHKVLICLSGGVDSSLLAVCARSILGAQAAPAFLGLSPTMIETELEFARGLCNEFGIVLIEQTTEEFSNPDYRRNDAQRCRYCKRELFRAAGEVAMEMNIRYIADGTISDDVRDYRPGLLVANEMEIIHPLAEAGMNKEDVRRLARKLHIPGWDRPASPCLSSRIAYGVPIKLDDLHLIANVESQMRACGFKESRCRIYHDAIRLEVRTQHIAELITAWNDNKIKVSDPRSCYVDLEGFVSGKLNRWLV